jgi:UDP-N-acetylglucosamine 4,6-dehydratase|tara:strand:+ start:515 stop:1510 length:996 start_codon:yes stop_codon:yes gene_type:complete
MENYNFLNNKVVLITGGTGSFGGKMLSFLSHIKKIKKIIIFSRDELKQFELQKHFNSKKIRYFIGDVRDYDRVYKALNGVDIVIHAAALKQVTTAEYNPGEAVKTNILGVNNIVEAGIMRKVEKIINLSTDKACAPINLYGATKLVADKLITAANYNKGSSKTILSSVRYGNVINSRGSVIPIFKEMIKNNKSITLTDKNTTRFFLTLDDGVKFVIQSLRKMIGGEIFIPKLKSIKIYDLIDCLDNKNKVNIIGMRPGEKIHEMLFSKDDSRNVVETKDHYILLNSNENLKLYLKKVKKGYKRINTISDYSSETSIKIKKSDLKKMIKKLS